MKRSRYSHQSENSFEDSSSIMKSSFTNEIPQPSCSELHDSRIPISSSETPSPLKLRIPKLLICKTKHQSTMKDQARAKDSFHCKVVLNCDSRNTSDETNGVSEKIHVHNFNEKEMKIGDGLRVVDHLNKMNKELMRIPKLKIRIGNPPKTEVKRLDPYVNNQNNTSADPMQAVRFSPNSGLFKDTLNIFKLLKFRF